MKSITIQAASISELESKINEAISTDFNPTLAIVFASVSTGINDISNIFKDKNITLFGASSSGEILDDEVFEQSIVAMLLDMNKDYFAIYHEASVNNNIYDIAKNAAKFAKEKFANPALMTVSAGLAIDGVSIIEGVNDEMKKEIPMFGGMAGDDLKMEASYIFTNGIVHNEGLLFLIIDNDKIDVSGMATSGWEAVGAEKTVTKSEGNIVYEIDNRPVLEIFMEYYGIDEETKGVNIGTKYPLQVIQEGKAPVLRTPLIVNNEDNSLIFAGRIPQGSKVRFSIQPTFEIIETTVNDFKTVQQNKAEADALVMFSCAGRHIALGPMMEDEVQGIRELWGEPPVVGLFTYGEIGNAHNEASNFHNETCSLVILKEK